MSKELIQLINAFRDERDWRQYHNEKDLALSISLEAAELLENYQGAGQKLSSFILFLKNHRGF